MSGTRCISTTAERELLFQQLMKLDKNGVSFSEMLGLAVEHYINNSTFSGDIDIVEWSNQIKDPAKKDLLYKRTMQLLELLKNA